MNNGVKFLSLGLVLMASGVANANLLLNGDLDQTYQQEIVPGFFLPKPADWQNVGTRSITGPYEDEMSSEDWAGPAPTPVTNNGTGGKDFGVFFKPFSGNANDGDATGHLYQDVAAGGGVTYLLTGWAGGEPNALMQDAEFALEFYNAAGAQVGGAVLSLLPTLVTPNGQAFQYKMYSVRAFAPASTVTVRARASMIGAHSNPLGGGQAYVVDDFELNAVPEPATSAAMAIALLGLLRRKRK
ncbi:MAG: PEP-CTERM sorting domain-containing protein [Armatimonadetes bacterium]|nr:PEP-CTERM sorting domain-containing protein [Armatimonadota bacterium]